MTPTDPTPSFSRPDQDPRSEIDFIKAVVARTHRRIDAHGFHAVHWGAIVLIWYPLANYFQNQANLPAMIGVGVAAVVLGMILSLVRGVRAYRRLPGGNSFVSSQVRNVAFACIGGGMLLSAIAPTSGWIDGENVPILWGLVYANLAFMLGVVYNRDFILAGLAIFAGSLVAMFLPQEQGYILGPIMGLGMIVPGLRAEGRLAALAETGEAAVG